MNDEEFEVVERMEKYGGGFVQALAVAFRCADLNNFKRLKAAFPDYWEQYSKM